MDLPIKIDLSDFIKEFDLSNSQVKILASKLVDSITKTFVSELKQKVNTTLKSTRQIYLDNLKIETIDEFNKEIKLVGWLPNTIEQGTSSFDMKKYFEKSSKTKVSKKGNWYLVIPFKYNNSTSSSSKLPKEISNIINKQKTPLKEQQIPESYRLHKIKENSDFGIYQHKNSIYTGISKKNNDTMSFRTVGAVSDSSSWIYPNLEKRDFFGKSILDISTEIPILANSIINKFLSEQGF